jgi:hypothetical protein
MLVDLIAPDARRVQDEQLKDVSLIFEGADGHLGISVCTQSNMISLAARLRRLKQQLASGRLAKLVLLRDARVPLSAGAEKARLYLDELEQQGAITVFPAVEALAALDALRELLSDAKSGDLAFHGDAVTPQTVGEWLSAHLSSALRDFVNEIFGAEPGDSSGAALDAKDIEALNSLLLHNPMVPLKDAAQALGRSPAEVAECVRRHTGHFGLLGQPPTMLFRAVDASASCQ